MAVAHPKGENLLAAEQVTSSAPNSMRSDGTRGPGTHDIERDMALAVAHPKGGNLLESEDVTPTDMRNRVSSIPPGP